MRNLILVLSSALMPPQILPTFHQFINDVQGLEDLIRKIRFLKLISTAETAIEAIATKYRHIDVLPYHVNRLSKLLLIRKCELLSKQYPTNEQDAE